VTFNLPDLHATNATRFRLRVLYNRIVRLSAHLIGRYESKKAKPDRCSPAETD
jgi:hypothetical protein